MGSRTLTRTHVMQTDPTPSIEDRVRAVAYALWLEEGRPEGRAEAHWHRAHQLVNAEAIATKPKRAAAKRAPAPRKRS